MVTNTTYIVTILVISLGITSTPVNFGETQQDITSFNQNQSPYYTELQELSSSNLLDSMLYNDGNIGQEDELLTTQSDDNIEQYNNNNDQILTPQSHGLIKNKDIGVLVYTHGNPMEPHNDDMKKTELIDKNLEKNGHPGEIVTHMPYNWDDGLVMLDERGVKYAVFLYTDLFGPKSTVIHNVTRGMFGEIAKYQFCPGVPIPPKNCLYMGEMTTPASLHSDTVLVFAEPARPDHPLLKNAFLEQAQQISENPKKEILVLVGHGAKSDTNDMAQVQELENTAEFVQKKMKFKDAIAVTAREDWPELQEPRIMEIVEQVKKILMRTHAETVILTPATGAGMGFEMVKEALEAENINVEVGPDLYEFAQKEFKAWSTQVMKETVDFIKKKAPVENTITPYWFRTYS
jgi:hypothetical protein